MTRNECISLSCDIKEHPSNYGEYSGYLYSAVGMMKQHPDSGTVFAANLLADAILEVTGGKLTSFCQRRVDIIKKAWIEKMGKHLTYLAEAQERADYNAQVVAINAWCEEDEKEGYLDG